MDIKSAEIKYFQKGGFHSVSNENIKHVKILPHLSVVQSVEGSYDIALGAGEPEQTGERGFFIAPSDVQQTIVHHVNQKSGKMTCRWIFIDVRVNNAIKLDALYQFPVVIKDDRKKELNMMFDRLFATDNIWENYSDCYKLLGYLVQMVSPIQKESHQGIRRAVAYITEHYTDRITISDLAKISNMSEPNLYAVFRKQMGDSPISYLNRYRLSVAADRLLQSDQTVNEISCSVGISDSIYFSKLFKKTYNVTPKEYRSIYLNKL